HSHRGRFQGGRNGALESTREGREQEAHHEDRERATCAESEAVVRSESETARDNLANHRGSQFVDDLLPTHNRISSQVAFVSNRERDNSSDRSILLGDSPCEGSTRSLTIFGLFADLNHPHMVYSGRRSYAPLSAMTLSGET